MAKILGTVALVALIVTLGSTIAAIWIGQQRAEQFLELTKELLSWKVIAGGLAVGSANSFHKELAAVLARMAQ